MANYKSSSSRGKGFYTNAGGISSGIDTEQLLKALRELPLNIQKNSMTGAIRAGANVVRDEARRLVPKDTHNLEKSIATIQTSPKKLGKYEIQFSVTPSRGGKHNGWYAHFLEFGTSSMPPIPFMRPAFETKEDEVLQTVKQYLADRLPFELAKVKR